MELYSRIACLLSKLRLLVVHPLRTEPGVARFRSPPSHGGNGPGPGLGVPQTYAASTPST